MFDLTGRVAVITGGSSGLGVLFGHALAKQGATVVLLARREEKLQKVVADIKEQHGTPASYMVCDVTDSKRVAEVALAIEAEHGKIDIAVKKNGKYVLGIECDGKLYSISRSARERDYHRQKYLETRGWRIKRLWSIDWWNDSQREIYNLCSLIDSL